MPLAGEERRVARLRARLRDRPSLEQPVLVRRGQVLRVLLFHCWLVRPGGDVVGDPEPLGYWPVIRLARVGEQDGSRRRIPA